MKNAKNAKDLLSEYGIELPGGTGDFRAAELRPYSHHFTCAMTKDDRGDKKVRKEVGIIFVTTNRRLNDALSRLDIGLRRVFVEMLYLETKDTGSQSFVFGKKVIFCTLTHQDDGPDILHVSQPEM